MNHFITENSFPWTWVALAPYLDTSWGMGANRTACDWREDVKDIDATLKYHKQAKHERFNIPSTHEKHKRWHFHVLSVPVADAWLFNLVSGAWFIAPSCCVLTTGYRGENVSLASLVRLISYLFREVISTLFVISIIVKLVHLHVIYRCWINYTYGSSESRKVLFCFQKCNLDPFFFFFTSRTP